MSVEFWLLLGACAVGGYVAFNIGGNDLANSMGTSVGSKALTLRQAVIIAGLANVLGATLAGGRVTQTVSKGIIEPEAFLSNPMHLLVGMFCSLIAAGMWIHIATFKGWPVSTTHSIIGALIGFGLFEGGLAIVHWGKILQIFASWIISPLFGGLLAVIVFLIIDRRILGAIRPLRALQIYSPFLIFSVVFVLVISFIYKGLKNLHLDWNFSTSLIFAGSIGIFVATVGSLFINKYVNAFDRGKSRREKVKFIERVFAFLQILTAGYVAFANGSNDVANAIGPIAAILAIVKTGTVGVTVDLPAWLPLFGGICIASGLALIGYRVIQTVGSEVTEITPIRGFSAEFGAATTIMACSQLGLPVSTTHTLVGAVVGIGLARGMAALNFDIIKSIISSWLITLPFTACLSALLSFAVMVAFGIH